MQPSDPPPCPGRPPPIHGVWTKVDGDGLGVPSYRRGRRNLPHRTPQLRPTTPTASATAVGNQLSVKSPAISTSWQTMAEVTVALSAEGCLLVAQAFNDLVDRAVRDGTWLGSDLWASGRPQAVRGSQTLTNNRYC